MQVSITHYSQDAFRSGFQVECNKERFYMERSGKIYTPESVRSISWKFATAIAVWPAHAALRILTTPYSLFSECIRLQQEVQDTKTTLRQITRHLAQPILISLLLPFLLSTYIITLITLPLLYLINSEIALAFANRGRVLAGKIQIITYCSLQRSWKDQTDKRTFCDDSSSVPMAYPCFCPIWEITGPLPEHSEGLNKQQDADLRQFFSIEVLGQPDKFPVVKNSMGS